MVAIGHGIMPRAEPGCGGRPYFITQHCVSGRLGQIEADDEPEALSLMLKTGGTILVQPYSQGTVSQAR